ncbi:MAG TPA: hypothetical protein VIK06_03105 [Candidatus Limnocylindrales bacterium]
MTEVPLEVTVAFQELVMAWLPPQVQVAFQVLVATVPGLLTVTVAVKPLALWLSTCMLAEQRAAPPEPLGVEVAVDRPAVYGGGRVCPLLLDAFRKE